MKCSHARKLISKQADGTRLGEPLAEHLAGCPSCRRFAEFCDSLPASLASFADAPAPSSDFVDGVMSRIRPERRPVIIPWRWTECLRPLPIGVAAAAFALGVFVAAASESVANGTESETESAEAGVYDSGFGIDSVDDAVFSLVDAQED